MSKIKLQAVHQLDNTVKKGKVEENVNLEFKPDGKVLNVRITVECNLTRNRFAKHMSASIWNNIEFQINPELISSKNFDTLISIVQASLGHARIMFINMNYEDVFENIGFKTNEEIGVLLKTLIQTSYN